MLDPGSRDPCAEAFVGEFEALLLAIALPLAGFSMSSQAHPACVATLTLAQPQAPLQQTSDVGSSSKALAELAARAEKLWPARPALIPEYERWLSDARELIEGRAADPAREFARRPGISEYESRLAQLRSRATAWTQAQAADDRESHPRAAELSIKRAQATWFSRMLKLEKFPAEADVEARLAARALPSAALELNRLAWTSIDPDRPKCGEEMQGLLLARRALNAATEAEDPDVRLSLAWAHFRLGQMADATAQLQAALEQAPSERQKDLERQLVRLEQAVERWTGEAQLADRRKERDALCEEAVNLERITGERRTWSFEHVEDARAHAELAELVSQLESLRDPRSGLMGDTLAAPFGWGIAKRLGFAKTLKGISVEGSEGSQRWREAIIAIASSPKYGGLKLAPQLGLVPIGEDRDSRLWEFAELQTGTPAERAADGRLTMSEDAGLVFVLIPGGTFAMGSQSAQPTAANFDPAAAVDETPAHAVTLDPYFLSKFEMTQGQWQRSCGANPSEYGPGVEKDGVRSDLLHPVENVTWAECVDVMQHLGLSLPSEVQWENGARAATATAWWTGQDRESLRARLNIADATAALAGESWPEIQAWPDLDDGWVLHAPVGTFPANAFGLHEVHGNVAEWCLDGYDASFYGKSPSRNPLCPSSAAPLRVFRGGCFRDSAVFSRCAARRAAPPEVHDPTLGLRPARGLAP